MSHTFRRCPAPCAEILFDVTEGSDARKGERVWLCPLCGAETRERDPDTSAADLAHRKALLETPLLVRLSEEIRRLMKERPEAPLDELVTAAWAAELAALYPAAFAESKEPTDWHAHAPGTRSKKKVMRERVKRREALHGEAEPTVKGPSSTRRALCDLADPEAVARFPRLRRDKAVVVRLLDCGRALVAGVQHPTLDIIHYLGLLPRSEPHGG